MKPMQIGCIQEGYSNPCGELSHYKKLHMAYSVLKLPDKCVVCGGMVGCAPHLSGAPVTVSLMLANDLR